MTTKLDKLRSLLRELFQLDQADLDFGMYRIMNQKRDEVERFLDDDLLPQVRAAFEKYRPADKAALQAELDKLVATIESAGMNPDQSPKVQDLRERLAKGVDVAVLEDEIFSDLFTFFRRYYRGGDFLSLRRYKEGVYAIPYEGEEVKLHWANHDQYYIKNSERLNNYAFKVGQRRVRFELAAASTQRDNTKAARDNERRFILTDADAVCEKGAELVIRFEYRQDPDKRTQEDLNTEASASILRAAPAPWKDALGRKAPTKANPERSILDKHLYHYTARNTFDYFIHKDLAGFLRRELDFFIKNEIFLLDDIDQVEDLAKVEEKLSKVRVLRAIAHKVIAFLAQLEDFQKKLWLKKKFVVETNWCITLDRIPKKFYPEIAANDSQREEWVQLFAIDEIEGELATPGYSKPLSVEFLNNHPSLILDTRHFNVEISEQMLAAIDGLNEAAEGLAVSADNFHGLSLLSTALRETVDVVYIDPPYNKGDDDNFPYKDHYQRSTWLSMLSDRLALSRHLLSDVGVLLMSIGTEEHSRAAEVLDLVFGPEQKIAELVWEKGRKNDARRFSVGHDYIYVYAKNAASVEQLLPLWREPKPGVAEIIEEYHRLRAKYGKDDAKVSSGLQQFYRSLPKDHPARQYSRSRNVDSRGIWRDNNISWPGGGGPRYDLPHPETGLPCVVPKDGWRFIETTMHQKIADGYVVFRKDHTESPFLKSYIYVDPDGPGDQGDTGTKGQVMGSVFYRHSQPSNDLFKALFGAKTFPNPKDHEILGRLIDYVGAIDGHVLDYFAGSGSTVHAVIEMNRTRHRARNWVAIEMGEYFDTVLLPRIKKFCYSDTWEDGRPKLPVGESRIFRSIRLESYEDALDNLELRERTEPQQELLAASQEARENYMLSYMLNVETQGSVSLLNIEKFKDPFNYKLKVTRNNTTQIVTVDLVETFNYLIGLRVDHMEARVHRTAEFERDEHGRLQVKGSTSPCNAGEGWTFRIVQGRVTSGERVLVIWRVLTDDPEKDNLMLDTFCTKMGFSTRDIEFDLIYVNGDNNLENLRRDQDTWKVQLIEESFHRLMFDVRDV